MNAAAGLFSAGEFLLYFNPVKETYTLSEASPSFFAEGIKGDLDATYAAAYFAEAAGILKTDEPEALHALLLSALSALDASPENRKKILVDYTWSLLKQSGVGADLRFCPSCERLLALNEVLHYSTKLSSPVCQSCADTDSIRLLPGARRYLIYTLDMPFEVELKVELSESARTVLSAFLTSWISAFSPWPLKSLKAGIL